MRHNRTHVLVFAVIVLFLCTNEAFAQIDLFGNIRETLDYQWRHAQNPWDSTEVYDIGWNVTPKAVRVEYAAFGTPAPELIPVPNTSQSFTNNTANPGTFPYEAKCQHTVRHTWRMTYGMSGSLVGTFNSLTGIDSESPDSGTMNLTQGQTVSRDAPYSQLLSAQVTVPANSSATYQAFFEQRPIRGSFEVDVKIGGSFRFKAVRGNTTANFTQGLGTFYTQHPHPHVRVLDDLFVIVTLQGEYTGAIGRTPGNFTCKAIATP
jgi:hypothetical protein